ncbi:MAG TPA: PBP1A family penicillin-binding protein [Patescibacteria group bacterium]|nr:PBP1A family penicillin-binding protein [Patescibacteria group bacterium]
MRFCFIGGLWCFALGLVFVSWCLLDMPDTSEVKALETRPSISILAADGSLIARYGGLKGDVVNVKDLPPYVTAAVLATEDRRFYDHFGIDPIGLARAMLANIRARHWVQGGSTITQQLAKNLFLTPDKTIRRKVQEALLAVIIDAKHSKDDILTAYLNRVYFGSGAYGIDAAARTYFGKNATEVTLFEGAVLAGLLKAPSRFSPNANPKLARERAKVVIKSMEDAGYIGADMEKQEIKNARITLAGANAGTLNRYFADWVLDQVDAYVANSERDLAIRTTFNPELQLLAEARQKALFAQVTPDARVSQAALVTMSMDGAVLALIGGVDYTESQYNRATVAQRQTGSSFKPFVYLAALEAGYSKDDVIEDSPVRVGNYSPKNYEGQYNGRVTLTQALAHSLNAATVRLLQEIGVGRLLDVVQRLGLTGKFRPELATGLGAGESTLLEMTQAYAEIGNGGHSIWPYAVLSVTDSEGNVLFTREGAGGMRLFSARDVAQLDDMLVQVVAQGTGQAAQLSRGHVAGKTGTTQDYRDAWFIGYTNNLVTGVWMGNDDNTPMAGVTGGKYPARLWHDYMEAAINVPVKSSGREMPLGDVQDESGFSNLLDRLRNSWGEDSPPKQKIRRRFNGSDIPVYNQ